MKQTIKSVLVCLLFFSLLNALIVPGGAAEPEKLISLDLKNVDIREVLSELAREKGISIVAGEEVVGPISLSLKEVTVDEAIKSVLDVGGYVYRKENNILYVTTPQERPKGIPTTKGRVVQVFSLSYVDPEVVVKALKQVFSELTALSLAAEKKVVVEATPFHMKRVEEMIRRIDRAPKQVIVEARILEIDWSDTNSLGNNLTITTGDPSESIITQGFAQPASAVTEPGLYYTVTKGTITTLLNALEKKTGFHVLASPRVIAVDGKDAEILSGAQLGYYLTTTTSTGTEQTVEFLEVGVKLNLKPNITEEGSILMEIHPEVSDGTISANGLPNKTTTETTTHLLVKDGEMIVLGGLLREKNLETSNAVPILGQIPLLGAAFRSKSVTREKKEVIVLISPTIMTAEKAAALSKGKEKETQQKFESYQPSIFK